MKVKRQRFVYTMRKIFSSTHWQKLKVKSPTTKGEQDQITLLCCMTQISRLQIISQYISDHIIMLADQNLLRLSLLVVYVCCAVLYAIHNYEITQNIRNAISFSQNISINQVEKLHTSFHIHNVCSLLMRSHIRRLQSKVNQTPQR